MCYPLPNALATAAINLMASLPHVPLRMLDALHLSIAKEIDAATVVTADRVTPAGAEAMGFSVVRFDR